MCKMCKCGRDFVMNGKGCCAKCWNEAMLQYDEGLRDASQHSDDVQPIRQPQHTYTRGAAGAGAAKTGDAAQS